MKCGKCGRDECQVITETRTTGEGFSVGKACCGWIIAGGPPGLLCGLCGEGKEINSKSYWICKNCGNKFMV